jgi:hypothetical protein
VDKKKSGALKNRAYTRRSVLAQWLPTLAVQVSGCTGVQLLAVVDLVLVLAKFAREWRSGGYLRCRVGGGGVCRGAEVVLRGYVRAAGTQRIGLESTSKRDFARYGGSESEKISSIV